MKYYYVLTTLLAGLTHFSIQAQTLWQAIGSDIYYNTVNIGIGTTDP